MELPQGLGQLSCNLNRYMLFNTREVHLKVYKLE